jgi:FkbH-like protein
MEKNLLELNYPLDISKILRKKKSIKKELLVNDNFFKLNIAILGGSTTAEIINILELFLLKSGIKANFYESEYNKYFEDALFSNNELDKFNPDIVYIHTTNKNIVKYPEPGDRPKDIDILISNEIQKFKTIWSSLAKFNCSIIQNNFDYPQNRNLGNLDCYDVTGKTYFINKLNDGFSSCARERKDLFINDINYLSAYLGLRNWFDCRLWLQAKYALSMDSIPELTFNISKIINSIIGNSKKCLVLDLDNTCWGGVIGDEGPDNIKIGLETALSESYSVFQKYVQNLKNRGITLAICSKNDLKNAKEGFNHPESILKFEDFSSYQINWDSKNLNIKKIAKELNIGLDSIVFIDDNSVERDIVLSQVPDVSVPNVGNDVVEFISYLDRSGYFEPVSISNDDVNRAKYYRGQKKRASSQEKYKSYDEFLYSLKMTAEIKSFSSIYLDRITQLTNKTNQFNLTSKRYSAGEIKSIFLSDSYIKIYGKLDDKYGHNGLIAIIIGRIQNNVCHIELWLMSCRVLKRDMEYAMLDELVKQCTEKGISKIVGYYYKSTKNNMVSNLYEKFGFILSETNSEGTIWKIDISNYENKNKFIGINND